MSNRTPLTDEQRALASDPGLLDLARRIAARFCRYRPGMWQECLSAAHMGLIDAVRSFDPAGGSKIRGHVARRIRGACMDAFRSDRPKGYRRKADRPFALVPVHSNDPGWRADAFHPPAPADELWVDDLDAVNGLMSTLPARDRELVRAYFTRAGARLKALARDRGVCESRASQIVAASLKLMRERLEARGVGA